MEIKSTFPWKVLCGFVVVNLIWGSTFLGIRIAVETIPPFIMAGTRFLVAGMLMVILSVMRGERLPSGWIEWRTALLTGILLLSIGNGFVSYAEVYVPSNQAALLVSTSALWMAWLGSRGVNGQPLSGRTIVGLMVGLVGICCMFWPEENIEITFLGAQSMLLISSLSWAVGAIYFRNQAKTLDPFMFSGVQMILGGLLLIVMSTVLGEWREFQVTPRTFAAWSYLVVFGSCLAFGFYVWLIDKIKSANLAMISYITPMIATLLGWLVLDETLSGIQMIGMAVIVTSLVLVTASNAE